MDYLKESYTDFTLPKTELRGIYRGVVEDNKDPDRAGRCRIRVFGVHTYTNTSKKLHEGVPTEHLVWAQPACPIFGGISKVGIYGVPCQGAHVFLFFEAGNIMQPRYFATAPGMPQQMGNKNFGFFDPDEVFPTRIMDPDWNSCDPTREYTDIFIIEDKGGNKLVFDSTPGNEHIYIENGGSKRAFTTYKQGSVSTQSGSGTSENSTGSQKTNVSGDSVYVVTGENKVSSGTQLNSVLGDKKEIISGASDTSVSKIENRSSGGLSWQVEGESDIMTGDKASYVSDGKMLVKSNSGDVKLEATLKNIEMMAIAGKIGSTSLSIDMMATTTATIKGLITSTFGGGIITKVDGVLTTVSGSAIVQITGGIIMIG